MRKYDLLKYFYKLADEEDMGSLKMLKADGLL